MPDPDVIGRELRQEYPRPSAAATARARAAVMQTATERSRPARSHRERRRRWALVAVAAVAVALAAGLSFYLIPQSTNRPPLGRGPAGVTFGLTIDSAGPLGPTGAFGSTAIGVTVTAPEANATLELRVLRKRDEPGADPSTEPSQLVYETRVPMSANPGDERANGGFPSIWSGTLSTSDWSGGCQQGFLYSIEARAFHANGKLDALLGGSGWRTCNG